MWGENESLRFYLRVSRAVLQHINIVYWFEALGLRKRVVLVFINNERRGGKDLAAVYGGWVVNGGKCCVRQEQPCKMGVAR